MTVAELVARVSTEGWQAHQTSREPPTTAEIARLAYHFYDLRGRQHGHDLEDWLLAEQALLQHYWLVADHT